MVIRLATESLCATKLFIPNFAESIDSVTMHFGVFHLIKDESVLLLLQNVNKVLTHFTRLLRQLDQLPLL